MNLHGVTLQTQPTRTTCVQTCLAMILDVPADSVTSAFGTAGMGQFELEAALTKCGVVWNRFVHDRFVVAGWHMAAVPSLNQRGAMHEVLIHIDNDSKLTVMDPAIGEKYAQDGSDLKAWDCLTIVFPGGRLP